MEAVKAVIDAKDKINNGLTGDKVYVDVRGCASGT